MGLSWGWVGLYAKGFILGQVSWGSRETLLCLAHEGGLYRTLSSQQWAPKASWGISDPYRPLTYAAECVWARQTGESTGACWWDLG